jgi:N-acetylmuramoyl-L-alanine amidase
VISSPNRSARGSKPVRLIVVHTAEGATNVTALGNYFARASVQASSHVGIDDQGVEQYVPYSEASWTLRSGNPISDNAELCGFAAWTRKQWLGPHRPMIERAAAWIRERCLARSIPIVKLTPAQVAAGMSGVIGHTDWTVGMKDGTHTDPGPGFPWDVVIGLATGPASAPASTVLEDDLMGQITITPDVARDFQHAVGVDVGGGSQIASKGWVTFGSTYGGTTWTVAALGADARVLAIWKAVRTTNNTSTSRELPDGTRAVTVEGKVDNTGTRPWATTYALH